MDIKELALKVAKEMNWRMDEMTLETFATRLIAALEQRVAELENVISEHGADMWAQGEEYAVLSAKCAKLDLKWIEASQRIATLEQQVAELVEALERARTAFITNGDRILDDIYDDYINRLGMSVDFKECYAAQITGALSKVKQP